MGAQTSFSINKVPHRRNRQEAHEDHTGVVHRDSGDGKCGWHAEEDDFEANPTNSYNVDDGSDDWSAVPFCLVDFDSLVPEEGNGDRDGVGDGESNDTH